MQMEYGAQFPRFRKTHWSTISMKIKEWLKALAILIIFCICLTEEYPQRSPPNRFNRFGSMDDGTRRGIALRPPPQRNMRFPEGPMPSLQREIPKAPVGPMSGHKLGFFAVDHAPLRPESGRYTKNRGPPDPSRDRQPLLSDRLPPQRMQGYRQSDLPSPQQQSQDESEQEKTLSLQQQQKYDQDQGNSDSKSKYGEDLTTEQSFKPDSRVSGSIGDTGNFGMDGSAKLGRFEFDEASRRDEERKNDAMLLDRTKNRDREFPGFNNRPRPYQARPPLLPPPSPFRNRRPLAPLPLPYSRKPLLPPERQLQEPSPDITMYKQNEPEVFDSRPRPDDIHNVELPGFHKETYNRWEEPTLDVEVNFESLNGHNREFKDSNTDQGSLENRYPMEMQIMNSDRESAREYEYKPLGLDSDVENGDKNPAIIEDEPHYNHQNQVDNLHHAPSYQHLQSHHSEDHSGIEQEDPPSEVIFYKKWYGYLTGGGASLSTPRNSALILILSIFLR